MAFHPLRTFQKNRKFWMASILLVCMVTFVLCTGLQGGDFGTWLINLLGGQRGSEIVRIDGKVYYQRDIDHVKGKRELANEYMRRAAQLVIERIQLKLKEPKSVGNEEQHRRNLMVMFQIQQELGARINHPPYFPADPNSLDDLVAHLILLHEADRLKIRLTDDAVRELVADEVFDYTKVAPFDTEAATLVQRDLRGNFGDRASYRRIVEALGDEFRARIARLALETSRVQRFDPTLSRFRITSDARMAVTPARMHDFWEKNRGEAEIAVVALRVENFLKDEKFLKEIRNPTEKELLAFFTSHKDKRYDPTAEQPGFLMPEQVKIQWVSADPKSKFYKDASHTATTLLVTPPVVYSPLQPLQLTAAAYAARSADWDLRLSQNYEHLKKGSFLHNPQFPLYVAPFWTPANAYEVAPYWTPYFALPLFKYTEENKPEPKQMASVVGAAAPALLGVPGAEGFQAAALLQTLVYQTQAKEMAPVIAYERQKRAPVGVTLVGLGASQNLLGTAGVWYQLAADRQVVGGEVNFEPHYQPLLGPLKDKLHRDMEAAQAQKWANANMVFVKDQLERWGGNAANLEMELRRLEKPLGLEKGITKEFRNKFDIDKDRALEPLKKSYEKYYHQVNLSEGRSGTSTMLKPDEFYRLFFGAEQFSVGNVDPFRPKPWPPTVTAKPKDLDPLAQLQMRRPQPWRLFESAERPFLFWRTALQPSRAAKELKEVRTEVEHAWKVKEARAALLPRITKAAEALEKAARDPKADLWTAAREQARGHKEEPIKLQNVAPLVPRQEHEKAPIQFVPFEVERDKFAYPTADMAKQLLSLRDLQKPLVTGHSDLDKLNQTLFDRLGKSGKVVQVLTNQPRTEFYIVAPLGEPRVTTEGFFAAYMGAQAQASQRNLFVDTCQGDFARQFSKQLMEQLYNQLDVRVDPEARKQFDERAKKRD